METSLARAPPPDPPRPWIVGSDRRGRRDRRGGLRLHRRRGLARASDPNRLVAAFAPPGGPALGRRRNHVRGVCFTGAFEANGAGAVLSRAPMFARPVSGRRALQCRDAGHRPPDGKVRVRGMGLQIAAPGGEVWRAAMIDPPFFAVSTPQAFYEMLRACGSKAPDAMKTFAAAHPEFAAFGSLGQERALDGQLCARAIQQPGQLRVHQRVRGPARRAVVAAAGGGTVPRPQRAAPSRPPDFLEQEIAQRIKGGPLRWTMMVTVAAPGDPTADPSKAWPEDRPAVEVGTLVVRRSFPRGTAPAGTSTTIPPSCPPGSPRRTTRSPPRDPPPTACPTTCARPKRKTIRAPFRRTDDPR